ncbi:MAG: hypothetical protein EA428_06140 [Spirochaetaceae bacterium]|nr:MAG: hypothetical protein EA428_06140 [Spirochaetaceae bacterium]
MEKIAVIILADIETHGDMGRVANALELAKEAKELGDDVRVIFDGAGTRWVPKLYEGDSKLAPLYNAVADKVTGACEYCSAAFGVIDAVRASGVPLLSEYDKHPSLRKLVTEGFTVLTF